MTYFRMNLGPNQGKSRIVADNAEIGQSTLCGREIEVEVPWTSITELSGDEGQKCARRTAWVERSGDRVPCVGLVEIEALLDGELIHPRLPLEHGPRSIHRR